MISSEQKIQIPPIPADAEIRLAKPPSNTDDSMWAVLSGLRFALAMVVLTMHIYFLVECQKRDWTSIGLWFNGLSAVFGFFIISGYSIAASIDREQKHYYQRRLNRIAPLYYSAIIFGLLCYAVNGGEFGLPNGTYLHFPTVMQIVATLFMLQTFFGVGAIPIVGPVWSLASEWWFYMIAPVLRKLPTWVILGLIGLSATAFVSMATPAGGGVENFAHGEAFVVLAWLWLTGFLFHRFRHNSLGTILLFAPSLIIISLGRQEGMALIFSLIVVAFAPKIQSLNPRLKSALNYLGDLSFPLYLLHAPVFCTLAYHGMRNSFLIVVICLFVAVAALLLIDYPSRQRAKAQAIKSAPISNSPNTNEFACIR